MSERKQAALNALNAILGFERSSIMAKVAALREVEAAAKRMADALEDWRGTGRIAS